MQMIEKSVGIRCALNVYTNYITANTQTHSNTVEVHKVRKRKRQLAGNLLLEKKRLCIHVTIYV